MSQVTRVVLNEDPFHFGRTESPWNRGRLDAKFISHPNSKARPFFCIYYLDLPTDKDLKARIHLTADERYQLFLDGKMVARGSERGDAEHWFYESYDLELTSNNRRLAVLVWSLGNDHAPFAQTAIQHGFLCVADDPKLHATLTTGHAPWRCVEVNGIEIIPRTSTYGVGDRFRYRGSDFNLNALAEGTSSETPIPVETPTLPEAVDLNPIRILRPALLPAMYYRDWSTFKVRHVENCVAYDTASVTVKAKNDLHDEHAEWESFLAGKSFKIAANRKVRAIIDLDNYICSYLHLTTTGGRGSKVRIHFQEALIKDFKDGDRGNRDEVEGGHFVMMWSRNLGFGDEVIPGGTTKEYFTCPWWISGRYMEIYIETGDESVELSDFRLEETHYPVIPQTPPFQCSDEGINKIVDICIRTLQMDAHETFYDCPYYEQLQYVGDSRIESMVMMGITDDNRLPAKATDLYRWSIGYRGITQSRYPSRTRQYIPPFSIWWVLMVHDQHLWRGDQSLLKQLLPSIRTVLSFFEQYIDRDEHSKGLGLMKSPDQWNFVDWVSAWPDGVPPGGLSGHSIVINMQLLLALEAAIELENLYGHNQSHRPILAWVQALRIAIKRHSNAEGLLLDSPDSKTVSEQQHALALLTNDKDLQHAGEKWYSKDRADTKATYYFQHYRHEAYGKMGRHDLLMKNIREQWGSMIKKGLKTTIEMPDPGRSDCHAWSAHPLLHLQTKILGLTPLAPFQFQFQPHLVDLEWAEGYVSTGKGPIHARVERHGKSWKANLVIPEGVTVSVPEVRGLIVGPKTVSVEP
jgi:alpha-L-rhamnosidase